MKKILLLPGLGDVHWVFLKLRSWLERQGPEWTNPEVSIWNIDNRPRTLEYLQFVPWVKPGAYFNLPLHEESARFNQLYMHKASPDALRDFHGFDAVIGTNGNMRWGVPFKRILQDAEIDWNYGPVFAPGSEAYGLEQRARGRYVVLCFSGYGMFSSAWCSRLSPGTVRELVSQLRARLLGRRFLFTGCAWDDAFARACLGPEDEHLVGATTLEQFLSLLRASDGYVGWCGGNAILAQHLGVPTVDWWSRDYFPKHDRVGWQHPQAKRLVLEVEDYHATDTPIRVAEFIGEAAASRA